MVQGGEATAITFVMPPLDRSNLVFTTVKCRGRFVEAIVDTGAEITIISPKCCKVLNVTPNPKWEGPVLRMVNGVIERPKGSATLEIFVNNIPVHVTAAVLPINGFDLLLGNNALRQLSAIEIDYCTEESPLFSSKPELEEEEGEKANVGTIVSQESRSIPARSMIIVPVEMKNTGNSNARKIIEPSNKVLMSKGISVGRILLPSEYPSNELDVRLVNFSQTDQWLNVGMVLGQIVEIEDPEQLIVSRIGSKEDGSADGGRANQLSFAESINQDLPSAEKQAITDLLLKYSDCFASTTSELGRSNIVQHSIDTSTHAPLCQPPYKSAWKEREVIQSQVEDMLKAGVVEPSSSPWASPVVLVKKKEGTLRFCVDYRKLNSITTRDVYPLPRVEDALSRLQGSCYFSIMDMQAGYWQVGLNPEDRKKSAFITADGLYQFKVMPFGLTNAPATFQRMMDVLLAGLKWNSCLVYLDDVVVFSKTIDEHLERLEAILLRFRQANLKLKLSKCSFLATTLKVLGYVVSGSGLSPDPAKLSAVQDFPVPLRLRDVQSFVGLCSYYRRSIKDFAIIARPLTNLTKKKQAFVWNEEQQASFAALKQSLLTPPVLGHPDYNLPMEIHCDASGYGLGAILIQRQDKEERVISYASRLLDKSEINYSVTEQECLALVFALDRFRTYVWGMKVRVVTDHHALCWLMKKRDLAGRLARWGLKLQDVDIEIVHRSGRLHRDADALSRHPVDPPECESEIPFFLVQNADETSIQSGQRQSGWWAPIFKALESECRSKMIQKIVRNYEIRGGTLFHRVILNGTAFFQLCVPRPYVEQVLLACHDDVTAGHLGVTRTLDKIRKRYFWPRMVRQIIRYVRTCRDCQSRKGTSQGPIGLLKPIQPRLPFERLGIDLIGPFPLSKSRNKYIIVAVDYLTKWVIAQPIPQAKTANVDFFVRRIVLQHGAPYFLISDRGKCLTSDFAEKLYRDLQTNHLVTAAYHPQTNGLVERFNHTFAQMLSMYVDSCHDDWDEIVDFVVFAYNTSRQESTGASPFLLLYGREAVLPIDVALGNNPDSKKLGEPVSYSSYLQDLSTRLVTIREIVKRRLIVVQAKQKKCYDKHRKSVSYVPGDLVWIYRPLRKKGRSEKLLHRFHGPYKVVEKLSDLNYFITPASGRRQNIERVHVSSMKRCFLRPMVPMANVQDKNNPRAKVSVVEQIASSLKLRHGSGDQLSTRAPTDKHAVRRDKGRKAVQHTVRRDKGREAEQHTVRRGKGRKAIEHTAQGGKGRTTDECTTQQGEDCEKIPAAHKADNTLLHCDKLVGGYALRSRRSLTRPYSV